MSKVTKEKISESEIELTIEVEEDKLKPFLEGAAKKLSLEDPPKGFRPGKVTGEHAKKVYGEMTLYETALNDVIRNTLPDAIREQDVRFIGNPDVTVVKCAPGNSIIYKAKLALIPKVTLGSYKDITVEEKEVAVEEKEIQDGIDYLLGARATEVAVEREVKDGDHVIASVKISLDNVPIEGATHKDHHIFMGKEELYPGISKKIEGMKKGEKKEASLPMPKDFWEKKLAGKQIEADISIKEVFERTLPELNDEFAKGMGPFKTVEDLKNQLRDNLKEEKVVKEKGRREAELLNTLVSKSSFTEMPKILIEDEQKRMLAENKQMIERQGLKWEDYLTHIKKTEDEMIIGFKDAAVERLKKNLILAELSKELKVEISEDDINKEWEMIKMRDPQAAGIEKKEPARVSAIKQHIRTVLSNKKIFEALLDKNKTK
jgi:trigger factor